MFCLYFFRARQKLSLVALAMLLTLSGSISAIAQTDPSKQERPRRALPTENDPQDIIKIDTDLVPVDVTVTDAKGRLVRNLRKEDFKLFEDGAERPIASFNVEKIEGAPRPVAIVFALDLSGSMTPEEVDRVSDAMREFSRQLASHPAVFALMTFGARHAPLTRQHQLIKRAVVLITDGFPVGDTVSPGTVIERANAADTSVYVVTMPSYTRLLASAQMTPLPTPLDVSGLVEKTGGRSVYANQKDLGPLFRAIAEEVASAYVLGFYPPPENRKDGRLHTIRIEGPAGLTLRQSRAGYQAKSSDK